MFLNTIFEKDLTVTHSECRREIMRQWIERSNVLLIFVEKLIQNNAKVNLKWQSAYFGKNEYDTDYLHEIQCEHSNDTFKLLLLSVQLEFQLFFDSE